MTSRASGGRLLLTIARRPRFTPRSLAALVTIAAVLAGSVGLPAGNAEPHTRRAAPRAARSNHRCGCASQLQRAGRCCCAAAPKTQAASSCCARRTFCRAHPELSRLFRSERPAEQQPPVLVRDCSCGGHSPAGWLVCAQPRLLPHPAQLCGDPTERFLPVAAAPKLTDLGSPPDTPPPRPGRFSRS